MNENIKSANPLGTQKESKLLVKFAIPCIISMLVTALYNIVDQIFIGQGIRWLWYLPDDDLRPCIIRIYLDPAYTHAEILRSNSGSSAVCTGIYPHCCDWISISDCKHWYEQADPRRRKSALFNDFHADRCHCKYDS